MYPKSNDDKEMGRGRQDLARQAEGGAMNPWIGCAEMQYIMSLALQ